jgi:ribosomal protein S18 acetylase RimI-like enzyme
MKIRRANIHDAEAVHAVVMAAFEEFRDKLAVSVSALDESVEDVRGAISEGRVLVALEGEDAVGTVRYEVKPDLLYVGRLAVVPSYRGKGVGAALMSQIEKLAPSLGRTHVQLATRESIPGNIAFYERIGYRISEKVQHPRGPDIVVWFEKELGEQA